MTNAAAADAGLLRRLLLALVGLGILGLLAELLLLEHYEDAWQWAPLVLLALALPATAMLAARPRPVTVAIFRLLMALCVAGGGLGVLLHYRGNTEFELERDPSLRGAALLWESLRGATPALAQGALAQLGLLGLALTWRHPALRLQPGTDLNRSETP